MFTTSLSTCPALAGFWRFEGALKASRPSKSNLVKLRAQEAAVLEEHQHNRQGHNTDCRQVRKALLNSYNYCTYAQ